MEVPELVNAFEEFLRTKGIRPERTFQNTVEFRINNIVVVAYPDSRADQEFGLVLNVVGDTSVGLDAQVYELGDDPKNFEEGFKKAETRTFLIFYARLKRDERREAAKKNREALLDKLTPFFSAPVVQDGPKVILTKTDVDKLLALLKERQ